MESKPFFEHIKEFRNRLIVTLIAFVIAFLVAFKYSDLILYYLTKPLFKLPIVKSQSNFSLIYTALEEPFFLKIKIALFASLIFLLPLFLFQIWRFISPALYRQERNKFMFMLISSPVLFWLGIAVAYFFVIPVAWVFFTQFAVSSGLFSVSVLPKASEYLSLFMHIILAFGIAFQFPVLLFLLLSLGLVKLETLKKQRRIAIVVAFIFAAIVTPPDPISQIILALFLIFLYELVLFIFRFFEEDKP